MALTWIWCRWTSQLKLMKNYEFPLLAINCWNIIWKGFLFATNCQKWCSLLVPLFKRTFEIKWNVCSIHLLLRCVDILFHNNIGISEDVRNSQEKRTNIYKSWTNMYLKYLTNFCQLLQFDSQKLWHWHWYWFSGFSGAAKFDVNLRNVKALIKQYSFSGEWGNISIDNWTMI